MFTTIGKAYASLLLQKFLEDDAILRELTKLQQNLERINNLTEEEKRNCAISSFYLFLQYLNLNYPNELKAALPKEYLRPS